MTDLILVLDRGTTNVKVSLFNCALEQVAVAAVQNPSPISRSLGWAEADIDELWATACAAVRQLWAQGHDPRSVRAIVTAGQGNGVFLVDESGKPVRPGILSLDMRAESIMETWKKDGRYAKAVGTLRIPFVSSSPLPVLAWLSAEEPETLKAARHLLFSKDWIRLRLTDEIATDWTDASGAGLINIRTSSYASELFELLDISSDAARLLPPLKTSASPAGKVTQAASEATGLPADLPVFTGGHDICAFHNGLASVSPSTVGVIFGTWALNLFIVPGDAGYPVMFNHCEPGHFLGAIGDRNAGAVLDTMLSLLYKTEPAKLAEIYPLVEEEAVNSPPSRTLFVPHLFGHALDSSATGSFLWLDSHTSRASLTRAVYEGIMLSNCVYLASCPNFNIFDDIWLGGGGAKSRILGQILADALGRPVHIARDSEMVGRGAAISAMIGLGELNNVTEAPPPEIARTLIPNPANREYYADKLALLREIMSSGLPWAKKQAALRLPSADGVDGVHA